MSNKAFFSGRIRRNGGAVGGLASQREDFPSLRLPAWLQKHERRLEIDISFIRVCVNRKLCGDRSTALK